MRFSLLLACSALLAGCNSFDAPLILAKVDAFGLNAAVTAPDQGGAISMGYRSAKAAIVPVSANGVPIGERAGGGPVSGAYSTFTHFEASGNLRLRACLGDTFATGLAAQEVVDKIGRVCGGQ